MATIAISLSYLIGPFEEQTLGEAIMFMFHAAQSLHWLMVLGCFVGLAATVQAAEKDQHASTDPIKATSPLVKRIEESLQEAKVSVDVIEKPLTDVIDEIKSQAKIRFMFDNKALAEAAIAPDLPVTKNISELPLRSALRLLLRDYDMTYVIRDEMLLITTKAAAENVENYGSTVIYPVFDLVESDSSLKVKVSIQYGPCEQLAHLITETIAPASWTEVGGQGTIKVAPGQATLVVSHTQEVHEQIQALLMLLRESRKRQGLSDRPTAQVDGAGVLVVKVYEIPMGTRAAVTEQRGGGFFAMQDATPSGAASPPAQPTTPPGPVQIPLPTAEQLVQVIRRAIEPKSWIEAGGTASIDGVPGKLIVRQTPVVHKQIEELLQAVFD